MALAHFQRTFTDASGNVKPGLSVTVRRESDNGLAALFADAGSVTPKSNPFNTDANGYGSFYVTDGRYRIQATDIDWRDTDIFISPTFYAQLAGGPLANFTTMPQVGGDPIVESGSNADGEWTRWSDGTMTQLGVVSQYMNFTIAEGDFFRNGASEFKITLPLAFFGTTADYSAGVYVGKTSFQGDASKIIGLQQIEHESVSQIRPVFLTQTSVTETLTFGFQVVGRWK
jgi:hypothetical protein